MSKYNKDVIKKPDLVGLYGKAWYVDTDAQLKRIGASRADDATVVGMVVEASYAHPLWFNYWMVVVHLREMPDKRETLWYLPGATHEFWIEALDPEQKMNGVISNGDEMRTLSPINFAAQFIASNDAEAADRVIKAAQDVIDGVLNPDTDFRKQWIDRFGNNMVKKEWR